MARDMKHPKNAYFLTMNTEGPARYAVRCVSLSDTALLQQLARDCWLQISREEYCDILRRTAQGKPYDCTNKDHDSNNDDHTSTTDRATV